MFSRYAVKFKHFLEGNVIKNFITISLVLLLISVSMFPITGMRRLHFIFMQLMQKSF